ncbi:hypothetical protein HF325_001402 [Metschnikowia pulcherrima]|uniref:Pre-rRNA-processing protein RIX1 n=1 Tax=Metschnikowia pulcherrima TaxID=27326 RepID=A0A8H7GUI9_9ASCO|nr:hypothetical protein HF325_001402 [Metschnikowia pulcherrima]
MSLPLAVVIDQLRSAPDSVIPILASLNTAKASFPSVSKVDLKHLTGRTLNLCRANDAYSVWCGINIAHVLADSSEIVGAEGSAFFAQILKVLNSVHAQNKMILDSGIECLKKLCDSIRGKPTLTREVLTPNLAGIFGVLLDKLSQSPELVLDSMKKLIFEHPTTLRPFANKLKVQLLKYVMEPQFLAFPQHLRDAVCTTLACLPVIEKEAPEQHWLRDVNALIAETANTAEIYASFLAVQDDQEASALLQQLGSQEEPLFPLLSVDINHPRTIFAISQRIAVLLEILKGYLMSGTKFAIRDDEVKEYVEVSLTRCHGAALALLSSLPAQFAASLVLHLSAVLATLELLVFLQGKRLDHAKILANEDMACNLISCATDFLTLTAFYMDHALMARLIESSIYLVQPRAGQNMVADSDKIKLSNQSKSARKKTKRNAAVPLLDILSHEHLFQQGIPEQTRNVVLRFFATIIAKVPISSTHYNKILKHVLVEAVKQADASKFGTISAELQQVLIASVLHPAPELASILPIATSILNRSETLAVLNSPRFPPLPVLVKQAQLDDEESEDDEGDRENLVQHEVKRFKAAPVSDPVQRENTVKTSTVQTEEEPNKENIFTSKPFKTLAENQADLAEVKAENEVLDKNEKIGEQ